MSTESRQPTFFDEVVAQTPGNPNLEACLQCGTCGGSCPSGPDMDHTPRRLFAMINAGLRDEVLESNTPWFCVSCYYCTERCPQDIHITDLMYALKRMAIQKKYFKSSPHPEASELSETFVEAVEKYGRSFELGLFTRFHLRHHPLRAVKMAPMGWAMLRKGRLDLTPTRIEHTDQLHRILSKAKELSKASAGGAP